MLVITHPYNHAMWLLCNHITMLCGYYIVMLVITHPYNHAMWLLCNHITMLCGYYTTMPLAQNWSYWHHHDKNIILYIPVHRYEYVHTYCKWFLYQTDQHVSGPGIIIRAFNLKISIQCLLLVNVYSLLTIPVNQRKWSIILDMNYSELHISNYIHGNNLWHLRPYNFSSL